MKKIFVMAGALAFLSGVAFADWISDAKNSAENQLKPLAGDIGACLGGGMAEPVKNGGLFGFDVGIKTSFAGISQETKNNLGSSLNNESYFPASWIYVSKGLPFGIDVFGRYNSVKMNNSNDTLTLAGGGIEYTVIKDGLLKPIPGVSVTAAINDLTAPGFKAQTISIAATVSKKLPFLTPFVTVGTDSTELDINTGLGTIKPKKAQGRLAAGVELRLIPFTYFNIAASKSGSETGFQIGLGIKN